jgi:uncharacterized membrane protein
VTEDRHSTFGGDRFGRIAEGAARFFGTPVYIVCQSIAVAIWIALNSLALIQHWDPYPFILLNLAFSTQAAYAAPLILLAQTRQAERDRLQSEQLERHREEIAAHATRREEALERLTNEVRASLEANTALTGEVHANLEANTALTRGIRDRLA